MRFRLVGLKGWRNGRWSRGLAAVATGLVCAGCASAPPSAETAETNEPANLDPDVLQASVPASTNPNLLTGDELRQTDVGNVYDALRRLRPQWMRARGAASMVSPRATEPVVYVAGIRRGELRTLQNVNIEQVRQVEFIDARDATIRFGTGHAGGVIWVDVARGN